MDPDLASGMSQRQRYCGCDGSDRNISTDLPELLHDAADSG